MLLQQYYRECGHAFASADETHALTGRGLEIDLTCRNFQNPADVRFHGIDVSCQLGPFQHDGTVYIPDPIPVFYLLHHILKQERTLHVPVPALAVREMLADITQSRSTQHGIANRMQQYISIRMCVDAMGELDSFPAYHNMITLAKAMRVIAKTHSHSHHAPMIMAYPRNREVPTETLLTRAGS